MYEERRDAIRAAVLEKIPAELRLKKDYSGDATVMHVPAECGLLTDKELAITEVVDATALRDQLAAGEVSACDAVTAFAKRAAIAHQLTCCLTDWFLPEAYERAKWLDSELARTGKPVGPLHGVPISVKDQVCVRGHDASAGYVSTIAEATEDAALIAALRDQGAVFYAKTNMPQAIMHLECESVYGRTTNPRNTALSSGGSSGGEGALLALRGSILGIGTDIGGSIRNPSAANGLYGFRNSANVLPYFGIKAAMAGNQAVTSVVGPMAHSLRDCDLFIDAVLSSPLSRMGLSTVSYVWGQDTQGFDAERPLRIGVMADDGVVRPHAAIQRGIESARKRFSKVPNVELVPYTPYGGAQGLELIHTLYFADGGDTVRKICRAADEPVHKLTEYVLGKAKNLSQQELWALQAKRGAFRKAFADHWDALGLDVVLAPVYVAPGAPHNTSYYWNYTALWNLLDFPCIVFPTGLYAEAGEGTETRTAQNEYEQLCLDKGSLTGDLNGAPISLQLVARTYEDARLLNLLNTLEAEAA